nr:MAG TPA: PBCV-1 capsid-measure protein, minor capsid proteins.5A [Caudoviricetes sp.]
MSRCLHVYTFFRVDPLIYIFIFYFSFSIHYLYIVYTIYM